jgi:hypothetical protein
LITFLKTHARGVHRFDLDENYAYISTEMEGFVGNILVIYDIRSPSKPVEVSRWWMPGQNVAAGEAPIPRGAITPCITPCAAGTRCMPVAGSRNCHHRCFGHLTSAHARASRVRPAACRADPYLPQGAVPIGGRSIAVSTEEERPKRGPDIGRPHAPLRTWDVTDPAKPTILCTYQLDEQSQPITATMSASARINYVSRSIGTACSTSRGLLPGCG